MRSATLLLGLALMSCADASSPNSAQTPSVLRAVPVAQTMGNVSYRIEAEAWRSYQPITTQNGDPLIVVARLRTPGSDVVSADVVVDALYLVHGETVWHGTPREEHPRTTSPGEVVVVARNGPRWPTGDPIDVVLRVRRGADAPVYIRAPRIAVARVD